MGRQWLYYAFSLGDAVKDSVYLADLLLSAKKLGFSTESDLEDVELEDSTCKLDDVDLLFNYRGYNIDVAVERLKYNNMSVRRLTLMIEDIYYREPVGRVALAEAVEMLIGHLFSIGSHFFSYASRTDLEEHNSRCEAAYSDVLEGSAIRFVPWFGVYNRDYLEDQGGIERILEELGGSVQLLTNEHVVAKFCPWPWDIDEEELDEISRRLWKILNDG